jgi:hypothetical protein
MWYSMPLFTLDWTPIINVSPLTGRVLYYVCNTHSVTCAKLVAGVELYYYATELVIFEELADRQFSLCELRI